MPSASIIAVLTAAALALCTLTPPPASAECMQPNTFAVPATGTELPPDPTVWIFAYDWPEALPEVRVTDGDGDAVEARVTLVSDSHAVRALRVDIAARSGALVLHFEHAPHGKRERLVLPPQMVGFFRPAEVDVRTPGVLELGHVDCTGNTFTWASPVIYAGIVAIHLDGRESPLPAEPTRLHCTDCR